MITGYNPFFDSDPQTELNNIIKGNVNWPIHINQKIKVFIDKFLLQNLFIRDPN